MLAVYRHQVEACAEAGPRLLAESVRPGVALRSWIGLFVDFLVTKHGLPDALHGDGAAIRRPAHGTSSTGSCRCAPTC